MEITKNKNTYRRFSIDFKIHTLLPRVWFSYWKSQAYGKSLKTFGSGFFKIHTWAGMDFNIFGCFVVFPSSAGIGPFISLVSRYEKKVI
jgi:hypothetical protein